MAQISTAIIARQLSRNLSPRLTFHYAPLQTSPQFVRAGPANLNQYRKLGNMAAQAQTIELSAPNGRKYTQPTGLFINNEFVSAKSGQTITSIDPATEQEIATVQAAGEQDVDTAVQAAYKALKDPSWKLLPGTERGQLMTKLADLLEQNKELLATIDAWDNGKRQLTR